MKPDEDDFYVGYLKRAPESLGKFIVPCAVLLIVFSTFVAGGLALLQRSIQAVTFEFGKVHTFEGVLSEEPYPSLLVTRPGEVKNWAPFSRYLLVGPGKFGASELVSGFDQKPVKLRGSLVYHDGQTLIELVPGSVEEIERAVRKGSQIRRLGKYTLQGEIVDSKCYLGVMNPGHLKTHKACAIRCISGGIPPVLLIRHPAGGPASYLLLVDESGGAVNERVLNMVAEPLEITGMVERHDNQLILKADPASYRRL